MVALPALTRSFRPPLRAAPSAGSREAARYDAALVERFNAGDETAFEEIVRRYHGKMYLIALRLLHNHADAEEIAQDTFIRAHRSLAGFRGDSSFAAWLHRIALNLARNRYWYFFRRHRHATLSLDAGISDTNGASFADLVPCTAPGPVQEATTNEFSAIVAGCMARLSPGQREILLLRNVRQHSYREIAGRLGITLGTVKSRIAHAREHLRALLVPYYGHGSGSAAAKDRSWFEPQPPAGLLLRAGGG